MSLCLVEDYFTRFGLICAYRVVARHYMRMPPRMGALFMFAYFVRLTFLRKFFALCFLLTLWRCI